MNKNLKNISICLLLFLFVGLSLCFPNKHSNYGLEVGDDCEAVTIGTTSTPGVCVIDRECPHLLGSTDKAKTDMYLTRCGEVGASPTLIICCPARKSFKECVKYGDRPDKPLTTNIKITKGNETVPYEISQFAVLAYDDENEGLSADCGGVLISHRFVLTAAHCLKRVVKRVLLGYYTFVKGDPQDELEKVDAEIERTIIHPNYSSLSRINDIALIELKKPLENLTFNIWPACLTDVEDFDSNVDLTIAGFGMDKDKGKRSKRLMKATVEKIPYEECVHNYTTHYKAEHSITRGITSSVLCARNKETNANTCQGDSGTGVFFNAKDSTKSFVVGITSNGVSCNSTLPSFYARVQKHLEWIEGHVWP